MSEHTKGPWLAAAKPSSVLGWPVFANDGRLICTLNYAQHSKIDPKAPGDDAFNRESAANAALIAAAPELLEALQNLIGLAAKRSGHLHEYKAAIDTARLVIAQSTGCADA